MTAAPPVLPHDLYVELGARRYPVHLRRDALAELVERIAALATTGHAVVISDETVAGLHAEPLLAGLRDKALRTTLLTFPAGEVNKTLATVSALYEGALDAGVDRQTPIVAFGGGVVGDVAGFVAATLLRGLPYVQLPTTVLAQVDSSVGGKTGVDMPHGKNLVGAFHQPRWVFADMAWLATLDPRETRAGLAEAVKHGALSDPALLDRITALGSALQAGEPDALAEIIGAAFAIKARIVAADEREAGLRAVLNLGHTVAHALEAATGYAELRHGEAVALGLRCATRMSAVRCGLPAEAVARVDAALDACGLPADWARRIDDDVLARVATDKKIQGQSIKVVLLGALGDPRVIPTPISAFADDVRALTRRAAEEDRR